MGECFHCFTVLTQYNKTWLPDVCSMCVQLDIWDTDGPKKLCKCGSVWNRECAGKNAFKGMTMVYYQMMTSAEKRKLHNQPGMLRKKEHGLLK